MRALIFGSIGVLVETSELQRQAYNAAFAAHRLDWHWNVATYCQLLATPGGQRRLSRLSEGKLSDTQIAQIHETKQQVFGELIASGVSARPGIIDSIAMAGLHGLKIGFVTTTTPETLELVRTVLDGQIDFSIFDVVTSKAYVAREKPDSEVYRYALGKLGIDAADVLAFEDTAVNQGAAINAGLTCHLFAGEYAVTTGARLQTQNPAQELDRILTGTSRHDRSVAAE